MTEGGLEPSGHLLLGLAGEGDFALLSRFNPLGDRRSVPLAALAAEALALGEAPAVAFVAVVESAGLVGATLRQSPAAGTGADERFAGKVRFGKMLLDQRGLTDCKREHGEGLKDVHDLPFNVISVGGQKAKAWPGSGVERLTNRLAGLLT